MAEGLVFSLLLPLLSVVRRLSFYVFADLRLLLAALLLFATSPAFARSKSSYCSSWHFNVEVDNIRGWTVVPDNCEKFVARYITGSQYRTDSQGTADQAIVYARNYTVRSDGLDAWVFDIDETSLSNVPYYAQHRFGAEAYNNSEFKAEFNAWVEKAIAPPLRASLKLFTELKRLGFSLFFLTGRDEDQRNVTSANLLRAGYSGWKDLILRQTEDQGVTAVAYKSRKRKALEDAGYTIAGNIGDQWSDITGYSVGNRVFKLPNPMYFIP